MAIIDGATSARVIRDLSKVTHIHTRRDTYFDQKQNPNVSKIVANSHRSLVLSSKVRAQRSLISNRNPTHKVEGLSRTYEISLYHLTPPRMVLNVPVCRVFVVVYTRKISALKAFFLKNGGNIQSMGIALILFIFYLMVPLLWIEYLNKQKVLEAEIFNDLIPHLGLYTGKIASKSEVSIEHG